MARAAALAPSPRTLRAWAMVETRRGNLEAARAARRVLALAPGDRGARAILDALERPQVPEPATSGR